ncbi:DUF503 domain-containing protein [Nakamurella silvestris]|nr:DUF503 domain-containing protein [Nakamurella silvestris]
MWIGWLELDVLMGDVHSLKEKRSVVRPLIAAISKKYTVSAAEADHLDLHRRAAIGVSLVAADRAHVVEVLAAVENFVADRPEVELLSAGRGLLNSHEE